MKTNPLQLSEWEWFKLRLRVEALEHNAPGIRYSFVLETAEAARSGDTDTVIRCYVYYNHELARMDLNSPNEANEIFLGWRSTVIRMIIEALTDTPDLAARMSVERQLKFIVLEGYGMGSKKVFELPKDSGNRTP
jgi:hypothetical protein